MSPSAAARLARSDPRRVLVPMPPDAIARPARTGGLGAGPRRAARPDRATGGPIPVGAERADDDRPTPAAPAVANQAHTEADSAGRAMTRVSVPTVAIPGSGATARGEPAVAPTAGCRPLNVVAHGAHRGRRAPGRETVAARGAHRGLRAPGPPNAAVRVLPTAVARGRHSKASSGPLAGRGDRANRPRHRLRAHRLVANGARARRPTARPQVRDRSGRIVAAHARSALAAVRVRSGASRCRSWHPTRS